MSTSGKITIQEIIAYFNTTAEELIPFRISEMSSAVKDAAYKNDKHSLEQLTDAMIRGYTTIKSDQSSAVWKNTALRIVAVLAYFADHEPITSKPTDLIIIKAYKSEQDYGSAMKLIKEIYDEKKIDMMKDVLQNEQYFSTRN